MTPAEALAFVRARGTQTVISVPVIDSSQDAYLAVVVRHYLDGKFPQTPDATRSDRLVMDTTNFNILYRAAQRAGGIR